MTDIVIPLSKESPTNNLQLITALRSIERYATNLGTIHIYSAIDLPFLKDVNVVKMGDPCPNCKDVNLINKVRAAAQNKEVADRFMFWSDDQLLTSPLDLDKAPVVVNIRGYDWFKSHKGQNKWYLRMLNTLEYVKKETGQKLMWNFDSHVPQPYKKDEVLDIFSRVPYTELPGFCINTIYYGMLHYPYDKMQQEVKYTFEQGMDVIIPRKLKLYAGHDSQMWQRVAMFFFLGMFYDPCKWEKEV